MIALSYHNVIVTDFLHIYCIFEGKYDYRYVIIYFRNVKVINVKDCTNIKQAEVYSVFLEELMPDLEILGLDSLPELDKPLPVLELENSRYLNMGTDFSDRKKEREGTEFGDRKKAGEGTSDSKMESDSDTVKSEDPKLSFAT